MARRKQKTLDEQYMGPEPDWSETPPPTDRSKRVIAYSKATHWYSYYQDKKAYTKTVLDYCEKELKFSKKEMQAMRKVPDWKLYITPFNFVKLKERGWDFSEDEIIKHHNHLHKLMEEGREVVIEIKTEKEKKPKVVISPHERTRRKVLATIVGDWDEMVVDKWMEGNYDKKEVKFPAYQLFQLHNLKGPAINMFKDYIQTEYDLVKDAYDKTCDQAVEAYSHVSKGNKKKMLVLMEGVFDDLERVRTSAKATRTANRKPRSRDDQVKNLKFLQEDVESKVVSVHPATIPTEGKLWIYNVKTRKLTEFTTSSTKGFEIRGSTLYNWDEELSRMTTLRKPLDILPQILNKTERQINNLWNGFTTKISKPTGRINKDTILLRVESYIR